MTEPDEGRDLASTNRETNRATYHWASDGDGATPSSTVIAGVAEVTDTDPEHLSPLYEVIDPEGLDSLFDPNSHRSRESVNGRVAFRFEGCDVTVHADGRTVVTRAAEESF